ncbi:MAG TPA: hypothetical protein VIU61_09230 [Kofleriaceae bacterium]
MMSSCDYVAERVALGEPLEELAPHVAECAACQTLVAMPEKLGATRRPVDPGLGFAARMTIGAQHKITVRRRQRLAASLAGTTAIAAVGVFVLTRTPEPETRPAMVIDVPSIEKKDTDVQPAGALVESEAITLVRLADTQRSRRLSAHWARIQRPLAPYKKLVKGGTP